MFVGWSCNLQSQPGALRHVDRLIGFVRREARPESGGANMTERASFERGTHFNSRGDLIKALER
jgi:hypothetical protein